jgi:predicted DNA-binding transcriptional regulator AlpA
MVAEYTGTGLQGLKEICAYVGKSANTVKKLIREAGFPAQQIGGVWESDRMLIDDWRRHEIQKAVNIKNR